MEPPLLYTVETITLFLVWLGIPALAFALPARKQQRNLMLRFFSSIFATWLGFIVHRSGIGLPASYTRAEANGNEMYDGIAMNVAVLFLGWAPALVSTVLALLIYLAIAFIHKRRNQSALKYSDDEPPRC